MSQTTKYFLASALPSDGEQPGMTISTSAQDREGDRVIPSGGDFKNFLKNPVLVWSHDYKKLPIGRVTSIEVKADAIKATWDWLKNDPFADRVKNAYEQNVISAASIGFIPKESTPNGKGNDVTAWELLELTLCVVPMNPTAVRGMKSLLDDADTLDPVIETTDGNALKALADAFVALKDLKPGEQSNHSDVSDAAYTVNILHGLVSSELASGHAAHADHLRQAASHVISYLQGEFNEQFGIAADGSPDISDAEIKDETMDDVAAQTDAPFIPMDDDSKYPFVSATGLTGDAKIALIKAINLAVAPVLKAGRVLSAANQARLQVAHGHMKAAHDTIGEVLACVKDQSRPTIDGGGLDDNEGGDASGMIALSLDDEWTLELSDEEPRLTLDLKDADGLLDVNPEELTAQLRQVFTAALREHISQAATDAIDRARGRVVV